MKRSLWEKEAIEDLTSYLSYKQSLNNLAERYSALDEQYSLLKSPAFDTISVQGEHPRTEDTLINNIVLRDKIKKRYERTKKKVEEIEKGLSLLSEQQRMILEECYIHQHSQANSRIMEKCHVEQSRAFQLKREALRCFTVCMYGCDRE